MLDLRNRLLVALYGFGLALGLTLGAGALVQWSSSAALAESAGQAAAASAAATAAQQQADQEKDRADALDKRLQELVAAGGGAAPTPTPTPDPAEPQNANPGFAVNIAVAAGQPALDATEATYVKVSYFVDGKFKTGGIPFVNGVATIPYPASGAVSKICLKHSPKWKVDPTYKAEDLGTSNDGQGRLECLPAPAAQPGQAVPVNFVVVAA